MQNDKHTKTVRRQKKHAASNNSWKGNNFAYIGRRRYIASIYPYIYPPIFLPFPFIYRSSYPSLYLFYWPSIDLSIILSIDLSVFLYWRPRTTALFQFFLAHISKVLRLPRKRKARSYEVLRMSRKIILANLRVWCSKMPLLWGNQRPDLLTCLVEMSLIILRLPREMHVYRSSNVPSVPWLQSFLKLLQTQSFGSILQRCRSHDAHHQKCRCNVQKMFWMWCALHILTSKRASRHNSMLFSNI